MKKFKNLCLITDLETIVTSVSLLQSVPSYAASICKTIKVSANETSALRAAYNGICMKGFNNKLTNLVINKNNDTDVQLLNLISYNILSNIIINDSMLRRFK